MPDNRVYCTNKQTRKERRKAERRKAGMKK
jgi:hypothetical protein